MGERLSDEDFHRYDEYLFGEDDTGMAYQAAQPDGGEGWRTQRRQAPRDRNSLWRLWLRGVPVHDSRVQALLQPYPETAGDWTINPWAVKPDDRLQLARKYAFCDLEY